MELALLGGPPARTKPFPGWPVYGKEEEESLQEVLRSQSWGGYSTYVGEFETALARLHGVRHAISCCNGSVALEVALRALDLECGDEVIVPPITFISTVTAVLICHGVPVFADIDPGTLNLSPPAVEASITPRTRAIIAVHFGGHPADLDALTAVADAPPLGSDRRRGARPRGRLERHSGGQLRCRGHVQLSGFQARRPRAKGAQFSPTLPLSPKRSGAIATWDGTKGRVGMSTLEWAPTTA